MAQLEYCAQECPACHHQWAGLTHDPCPRCNPARTIYTGPRGPGEVERRMIPRLTVQERSTNALTARIEPGTVGSWPFPVKPPRARR